MSLVCFFFNGSKRFDSPLIEGLFPIPLILDGLVMALPRLDHKRPCDFCLGHSTYLFYEHSLSEPSHRVDSSPMRRPCVGVLGNSIPPPRTSSHPSQPRAWHVSESPSGGLQCFVTKVSSSHLHYSVSWGCRH
jgi:hypothetical protein